MAEEDKLDMAAGGDKSNVAEEGVNLRTGMTEDETILIEALRVLGIQPKIDTPEQLVRLTHVFSEPKDVKPTVPTGGGLGAIPKTPRQQPMPGQQPSPGVDDTQSVDNRQQPSTGVDGTQQVDRRPEPAPRGGIYNYPKLSIFYGEKGKGEVTWESFKFEVESFLAEKVFTPEQILIGMRRSLKGAANDNVRRLGPGVSLDVVMDDLETAYGNVESRQTVTLKLYTCKQAPDETVDGFAARLEEIFGQAATIGIVDKSDRGILKESLHRGLRAELRQESRCLLKQTSTYEEFKREVRKIEAQVEELKNLERKPGKAAVTIQKEKTDVEELGNEIKEIAKKLNDRIDALEKGQTSGDRIYGGGRGRQLGQGRFNRGKYVPKRPTGSSTFTPTCFYCKAKGHLKRDGPELKGGPVCFKCREKGHIQKNCPKE